MSLWYAPLLGLVQGLTEFLPVSSSGHLALAQLLLPGFDQPGLVLDVVLHVGTAAAVVWFERLEIAAWWGTGEGRRLVGLLVVGAVATALVAFPLRDLATAAFERTAWVGGFLVLTGGVVASTRLVGAGGAGLASMGWRQAAVIGLAQGVAVFPGLSRSGVTIAAGLVSGLDRAWAARFSFLLSVPVIVGGALVEVAAHGRELAAGGAELWAACSIGGVVAAVTGYLSLRIVVATLGSRSFHRFSWYCLPVGALVLALGMLGHDG